MYFGIPESERVSRAVLDSDLCIIDQQHYFIKGRICIPIQDYPEPFVWLAWASLSKQSFQRVLDTWETRGREAEEPCFGWLSTELPVYPSTLNLPTTVHTMPLGERPLIVVRDEQHPLSLEQEQGMTMRRVREIAEQLLHE